MSSRSLAQNSLDHGGTRGYVEGETWLPDLSNCLPGLYKWHRADLVPTEVHVLAF